MPEFYIQTQLNVDLTIKAKSKEDALAKVEGWVDNLNRKRELDKLNGAGVDCDDVSFDEYETKCVGSDDE